MGNMFWALNQSPDLASVKVLVVIFKEFPTNEWLSVWIESYFSANEGRLQ
jgi:hypothetical protein